jgi:CBS domain-containing protein
MLNGSISEESFFFIRIENLCKRPPITCPPDMDVVGMSGLMRENDVSGLVVVDGDAPVGIVSLRDCRDLLASSDGRVGDRKVREIMTAGLITIGCRDYVFEAIFKMAKHNIHRLVVVDDAGELFGVITDTDIMRLQSRTPLYLHQEMEAAQSIDQLKSIGSRMLDMVRFATRAGADTKSLVQLISHFNDAFTLRLVSLLEAHEGTRLPERAAYLALGSEGRGEQTLRTDQDSAIVYADDFPAERFPELEHFSVRLVSSLAAIGVPPCPGDTMASNPRWRHSLSEWKQILDQWISVPTPEHMVNFGMLQDLRTLHGDSSLEEQLHEHILAAVRRHSLFLPYMARHIVRFQPPLGMFGRIRVERRGEHRGKVDLKKAGIFAFTLGTSLLALEAGIVGGSTWDKMERLEKKGVLSAGDFEILDESFTFLVQLRLERQLRDLASGTKLSNHVDPMVMTDKEREQFRKALKGVSTLLRIIRDRYKLDFISR